MNVGYNIYKGSSKSRIPCEKKEQTKIHIEKKVKEKQIK